MATLTGLVTSSRAFAATLSTSPLGRWGDRVGHRYLLRVALVLLGVAYILHSMARTVWDLIVLQALVGIGLGGLNPAVAALLARYTRAGEEGAVYGWDNSVVAAARTVAPMVGASVAVWAGLRGPFLVAGVLYVLVALAVLHILPAEPPG